MVFERFKKFVQDAGKEVVEKTTEKLDEEVLNPTLPPHTPRPATKKPGGKK